MADLTFVKSIGSGLTNRIEILSEQPNGATAVGFELKTRNTLSTDGANLLRLINNATTVFDFSFQGGIDHVNSGASTAAHSQSLNLNWTAGTTNTSSGQYSCVIGSSNTATAQGSLAIGVGNNTTGVKAATFCGANTTSGDFSLGCGRQALVGNAVTLGIGGAYFASNGDAQAMTSVLKVATTDATQSTMLAASTNMIIQPDTTWCFSGLVVARSDESDGNVSAGWKFEGILKRDESASTVITNVTVTEIGSAFTTAAVAVEADNTNEALAIKVTGEASTNIRWVAKLDIAQVGYA